MSRPKRTLIALTVLGVASSLFANGPKRVDSADFQRQIRPILSDHCYACHGPDSAAREADLRLDVRASLLTVIKPGDPAASELIRRLRHADPEERMPPAAAKKELSSEEIAALEEWVSRGAPYDKHWAFAPPEKTQPPRVDSDWPRNAIDRFVLARLRSEGLAPSQEAEATTLLSRVSLDLIGLPPSAEEIDAFLADRSSAAYENAVDRLLASPRYGEHTASFWLDAARYADTDGYQNDRYRYQWAWRDWVIRALNQNMPYDQFVIEQLAGDQIPNATLYQQVASGFGRNHRINSEAGSIADEWQVEYVVDRVDTLGTVFLGLTVACARCHEHKYDPITQKEYYRLFAYFNNVPEWGVGPNNGNSPPYVTLPESWPDLAPEENRAIDPGPLEFQKKEKYSGLRRPVPGDARTVMVMHERDEKRLTYLLNRGQYQSPDRSEVLEPAVPESLNSVAGSAPGDRMELAEWLVHPSHPLTARVEVNRYWQRFFGIGLVETSENFGVQGTPPTHPALLDWLAIEFMEGGWDRKAIHRAIVTSSTYRQSSALSAAQLARDPKNRLLARGPRQRLSAFSLRDQALFASGLLVERIGGPSAKPYMPPKIWSAISNNKYEQDVGANLYRRSVYTYWRRTIPPPTMVNFNAAEREVCEVRKERTNTPLQALTLLNNDTFVEAARFLAERMIREADRSAEARLIYGFRLATGRKPAPDELDVLRAAHEGFQKRYRDDPDSARELLETGAAPRDVSINPAEHAAMTLAASLILNLDETVTKE